MAQDVRTKKRRALRCRVCCAQRLTGPGGLPTGNSAVLYDLLLFGLAMGEANACSATLQEKAVRT
ncbi:MAG: hypothetical protein ACK6BC_15015, partial [Cyanobacteriota bacterium]